MRTKTQAPSPDPRAVLRQAAKELPAAAPPGGDRLSVAATSGSAALQTKLIHLALVAAMVCGPAALVVAALPRATVPVRPAAAATAAPAVESIVADLAAVRVRGWLSGASESGGSLWPAGEEGAASVAGATAPGPAAPDPAGLDARTLSIVAVDIALLDPGAWWVTVAADAATGAQFYAVEVRAGDDGLSVVGLPSVVAAPAIAVRGRQGGSWQVPGTHPVAATVAGFLAAYLVGDGDPGRWTAPGVSLGAAGRGYDGLRVTGVSATARVDPTPTDGDSITVLVAAEVSRTPTDRLAAEYVITMTARDDRWEVTSLLPPSIVAPTAPRTPATPASSTPASSTTPTEETS